MTNKLLIIVFVFVFQSFAIAQNKSVYTDLTTKNCKDVAVDEGMPGNYVGKCKGTNGYDLEVYLDDERNSIGIVFPSQKVVGLDFWNHFGEFSELGTKAEWRIKNGKPVAMIVRLNISDPEDYEKKVSYLMVAKIGNKTACVTDIVKPTKGQNLTARIMADNSSKRPCKKGYLEE